MFPYNRIESQSESEAASLPFFFGEWIKLRRKELDLTQAQLAQLAGCSVTALRKIEAGVRRPSKQLAGLIAEALEIPPADQPTFIRVARGELNSERLRIPNRASPVGPGPRIQTSPPRTEFPGFLTPFLGREPELTALERLIMDPECRLLTLTGPGGIGKTRLALEAAARRKPDYQDGVWFIPLAPLNSHDFLVPAIADALSLRFQDLPEPRLQLLHYLHGKQALLLLDNIEHLLDGIGLLSEILEQAPRVRLLATSRERLNLHMEWVFEIQGLPVPLDHGEKAVEEYSSVALFLQSARRAQVDFVLQEEEHPWAARICQLVEGMPLGIELAAAWVRVLSCQEIAQEIERNIDFLAIPGRDLPERHRSLRATLDYSWKLISDDERVILSRMAVFQGSFTRDAAEDVCDANLTALSSLRDKSLLRHHEDGLYDLHELIRQFAVNKLAADASEEKRVTDRHALYFARQLSKWEIMLKSERQLEALSEITLVIDDVRLAWQRIVAHLGSDQTEGRFFTVSLFHHCLFSLSQFFEQRCRYWEAVNLFEGSVASLRAARNQFANPANRWRLDAALGVLTAYLGLHHKQIQHNSRARDLLEEAQTLLQDERVRGINAQVKIMLAWVYHQLGEIHQAVALFEQSLVVLREEVDLWWYTLNLGLLARAYLALGKIAESIPLIEEGLQLVNPGDLRLRVPLLNASAHAAFLQGDYAQAENLWLVNQENARQLGNQRMFASTYLDLGRVALANGQLDLAQARFQNYLDLLSEFGESDDLALGLIYTGKCLAQRGEIQASQEKFVQTIQIGRELEQFHLVYWGLVNLAALSLKAGKADKALEMALVLRAYSVEFIAVQMDYASLWEAITPEFSPQQVEAASIRIAGLTIDDLIAEWTN